MPTWTNWSGLATAHPVRELAGTTLKELNSALATLGLSLHNMGDVEEQTLAGAISTGTHGTGGTVASLSAQVAALELVIGDGTLVRATAEENPAGHVGGSTTSSSPTGSSAGATAWLTSARAWSPGSTTSPPVRSPSVATATSRTRFSPPPAPSSSARRSTPCRARPGCRRSETCAR